MANLHFAYRGFSAHAPQPSQNVADAVNRLGLRFQDGFPYLSIGVFYDDCKNYVIQFSWKYEAFFKIVFSEDDELCYFAGYDDLKKPLDQWCRASFEKFPFEDRYIPEALCALLKTKPDPENLLYLRVVAMIKPGERIPIECE